MVRLATTRIVAFNLFSNSVINLELIYMYFKYLSLLKIGKHGNGMNTKYTCFLALILLVKSTTEDNLRFFASGSAYSIYVNATPTY